MSDKMTKRLRKYSELHQLPKPVMRKIRKIKQQYNLNLTDTLYLIDAAAQKYYKQMNELSDKIEKELKNEDNS